MSGPQPLASMLSAQAGPRGVRTPKAAELLGATLRMMIVGGRLKTAISCLTRPTDGPLPGGQAHFAQAVRVPQSNGLVQVRHGARTGARVQVPGPEIVTRPSGLPLDCRVRPWPTSCPHGRESSHSLRDCSPNHARTNAHQELEGIVSEDPRPGKPVNLRAPRRSASSRRRVVGNTTLALIAAMLREIAERDTTSAICHKAASANFGKTMKSRRRLADLVAARDGALAEAHWHRYGELRECAVGRI